LLALHSLLLLAIVLVVVAVRSTPLVVGGVVGAEVVRRRAESSSGSLSRSRDRGLAVRLGLGLAGREAIELVMASGRRARRVLLSEGIERLLAIRLLLVLAESTEALGLAGLRGDMGLLGLWRGCEKPPLSACRALWGLPVGLVGLLGATAAGCCGASADGVAAGGMSVGDQSSTDVVRGW